MATLRPADDGSLGDVRVAQINILMDRRRGTDLWPLLFGDVVGHPYRAEVLGHTLSYSNGRAFPLFAEMVYGICTCAPLLLSSARTLRLLGLCVLGGLLVSFAFYYFTLLSVWCFFAALASGVIFFRAYVERPRLQRHAAAGG